ncbi:MAG TPA: NAD(P)/FAD-dependent oxidoreductase [Actinomycetes bacterium]|nr:NAD(P)/FAD-dependent oxidoreductase [Actinomycetes bacterium]
MRIVVVGAGFAGLMAAYSLDRVGHEVIVVEARDRVGGRVWSQELIPGNPRTVVERGAEFVLDGYDVMSDVVGECGLHFAPMGMSYYVREPRGVQTDADAVAACAATVRAVATQLSPAEPFTSVLARVRGEVDEAALAALVSRLEVTNGAPAELLTAAAASDVTVAFEASPSTRVAGGNQRLAIELAARLDQPVRTGEVVRRVQWTDESARVLTDRGSVDADRVVMAVPLTVSRQLDFEPDVPSSKREAWDAAGISHAAKLHVPLVGDDPVAPSAVQSVPDRYWTWTSTDGTGAVQPVLHCFGGSQSALEALDVAAGPTTWARRAADLRPGLRLDLERAVVTTWADDPYAQGVYEYPSTGWTMSHESALSSPMGAVHFAGEHTAGAWAGLMEGALRSGLRVSEEIRVSGEGEPG